MNSNKKALIVFAVSCSLCWMCAGVIAYVNQKPDVQMLPPPIQKVIPLDKPTNIELEDDAGVPMPSGKAGRKNPQRDPILNTWNTRHKRAR